MPKEMSRVQYEVIMTDIGHTMQRDGEFIVFGDVMFGLPNNGRSRISSYGEGPDKQSARQSLIERAIEHLHRDERMSAKMQQQDFVYYAESNSTMPKIPKGIKKGGWELAAYIYPNGDIFSIEDFSKVIGTYDIWYYSGNMPQIDAPKNTWIYDDEADSWDWDKILDKATHQVNKDYKELRAEEKKPKKKPSKSAAPVEVVNSRAGFFDDEQDKEYFGFGFIVGGIIVGVLGTIFGNIFSELVLDEMRVKKFGYRDSGQTESSFWELDSD